MKTTGNFITKTLCILLCLVLLAGYLPITPLADSGSQEPRVADTSTMDGWKSFFQPEPLDTNNAGAVWTDKSVFTDEAAFAGTGIKRSRENSFLAALSAMGSNMSVTGMSNVPTDTIMILDLSSSMYDGYDRNPATVQTMLSSVNQSIEKLQALNRNNRVGVVVYYGGTDRNQSTVSNSMVLLPLDRYSGATAYLKANVTGGRLISVAVNSGVRNSAGTAVAQATRTVTDVAGTYAQLGILDAMSQFLQADPTVPATADYQPDTARTPVFIFMSDGEPTAATHNYTQKVNAGMGNNTVSIRNPNETDFVTQLTAAYAREMVDVHYAQTTPLFYTLSLGSSVSLSVMDPANHTTATINSYWEHLLSSGQVDITVYNSPNGWSAPTVKKTYTVSTTTANGTTFPISKIQKDYVDMTFTASTAGSLTDAFTQIVDQINLVSKYTPTLVSGNADLSGYISFVDKIGSYMKVTDIKGILIDNTLYSGAELARNFVTGGGELGTYDQPTKQGDEMVFAVQERLGLSSTDAARTLISLAYECGQLSYTSDSEYSNYIGWYANAKGEFLGFWHEDVELPEATGNAASDPVFTVKSYGYLGAVDESHGVSASDMMYATVQVREHIVTGEQTVAFAVPAALIPLITYEVTLDLNGDMSKLNVTGAKHPIRLVYEIGLDEKIHEGNLKDMISEEYLAENTNPDGSVNFYTNQYEADNSTGYGKVNTYSYFNPSRENDKYYYLQDTPVCTDTSGTRYTGELPPKGVFYRHYTVYTPSGAKTVYRQLSDAALATAKRAEDDSWYIGAGNVHVNLDGYTIPKGENITGTLTDASIPFVDTHDHSVGDLGYRFIMGATLGNNGRMTLIPETGIALSKKMIHELLAPKEPFTFVITNLTNPHDNRTYSARITDKNQQETQVLVPFSAGTATIALSAGQTIYIGGMDAGSTYTIEEVQTTAYIPQTGSYTITLKSGEMTPVTFVNAPRGTGSLLISKEVFHSLGSNYIIPEDKSFEIHVKLSGVGVANTTFQAIHSENLLSSVTTDENGCFRISLKHDQQLQILGLPEGTLAQVTEPRPGAGFTVDYQENGAKGDGIVTIPAGSADVAVHNHYAPAGIDPVNIVLHGTKHYITAARSWNGAEFEFQLQKWTSEGWTTIDTATASESHPTFDFNAAMQQEKFSHPGDYHYQVIETNGGKTINGVSYDATLHTFTVSVTDQDMDGKLEIYQVTSAHTGNPFHINESGNWQIDISFENHYNATGCDLVLDIVKRIENPSHSPLVSPAGFHFGLYQGNRLVGTSELSDGLGEARLIMHYRLEDEGTHTYTLKELIPDQKIPGMHYDETSYTVVVEVTDLGNGTMQAEVVSIDGKTDFDVPVFTNQYTPEGATLEIDFVSKVLTGRDLIPGEFTFELRSTDHDQVITGTNDADGNVIFSDALYYDAVGIYHYELRETSPSGKGVTADEAVYTVRVAVVDAGGQLTASYAVINLVGIDVFFQNTYHAQQVTYTIGGTKELTGRTLINEEFTFQLSQVVNDGGNQKHIPIEQTRNFAEGNFRFEPITFVQPGSYTFHVSEIASGSADYGIVFDDTCYLITLTVTDNLEGKLVVSNVKITNTDGEKADSISFINRYIPQAVGVTIPGSKELAGKVLIDGAFLFELHEADENWSAITLLETVKNHADGSFTFSQIDYTTAGPRHYLVREVSGGQTLNGIVYDDTEFHVLVDVTDNLRGQLQATLSISDSNGISREGIVFHNLYTNSDGTSVMLEGTKELIGKELQDGEFTFQLFKTGEDFVPSGSPIQTAVNHQGKFEMTLDYNTQDLNSTLYYTITEENAGKMIDGISYSSAKYDITVKLLDDGKGGIQPQVSITDGSKEVSSLVFVNKYQEIPGGSPDTQTAEVQISGTKLLIGKPLNSNAFTFALYESDQNWTEGSRLQTTVNGADGSFAFLPISLDTTGTRHYLVKEENGGKVIQNVLYDDTVYRITIHVTDNGNGQLAYTMDICTQENTPASAPTFRNRYVEPPPKTADSGILLWLTIMVLSCGAVITALGKKKWQNKR